MFENVIHFLLWGKEIFYYRTENGLEVDFICRNEKKIHFLVQATKELGEDRARDREIRALTKAMEETNVKTGFIVTYEEEGEIKKDGFVIPVIPSYKFFTD